MSGIGLGSAPLPALVAAAAAAFLLATIWHELGHLLAAWRLKVPVRLIAIGQGPVLWRRILAGGFRVELRALPLGMSVGVQGRRADDGRARRPVWHDIVVAAAGPAASFVLGFVLIAAALAAHVDIATPAGAWLIDTALLSALLGAMNLIPLPGLDGGHLLMLGLALRGWQVAPQREVAIQHLGIRLTTALVVIATLALVFKAI